MHPQLTQNICITFVQRRPIVFDVFFQHFTNVIKMFCVYLVALLTPCSLKVIYHPLYSMNNYVLIWGDWLCDPLRGSHIITPYKKTLVPHLVATLIYLSQIYSYYIRGDISPLSFFPVDGWYWPSSGLMLGQRRRRWPALNHCCITVSCLLGKHRGVSMPGQ